MGVVPWPGGGRLTLVVKTTFAFSETGEVWLAEAQAPLSLERYYAHGGLLAPSDFSPRKTDGADFALVAERDLAGPGPISVAVDGRLFSADGPWGLAGKRTLGQFGNPLGDDALGDWEALPPGAFHVAPADRRLARLERLTRLPINTPSFRV